MSKGDPQDSRLLVIQSNPLLGTAGRGHAADGGVSSHLTLRCGDYPGGLRQSGDTSKSTVFSDGP